MVNNSDQLIRKYLMDLCNKLERKIELDLGRKFESLDCEKNIDSFIHILKENNIYDKIITKNLGINKRELNLTYVGFFSGITQAHAASIKQKGNHTRLPHNILEIQMKSYLIKYRYNHFKVYFLNVMSNIINDPDYKRKSLQDLVKISKGIPDRYIVSLSQEMSILNAKYLTKLDNPPADITDEVIDEYCEIYDKGCKCLEKYIKISFKFVNDIEGNVKLTFKDIQRKKVYPLKEKLEQHDSNFKALLKLFSTIIWNTIKHGEKIKNPTSKKITFQSIDGKRILSYGTFMRLVGELFSVLYLFSRFSSYLLLSKPSGK